MFREEAAGGCSRSSEARHSGRKQGVRLGEIQGRIQLSEAILVGAKLSGQQAFEEAQRAQFCGDQVEWLPDAKWMPECRALFPRDAVERLGLTKAAAASPGRFYSTHGVDPHIDGEGLAFVLVLANDGLKFRQGRVSHVTEPGEWFIFDDRLLHSVKESRRSTSYVFWHLTLTAKGA